MKTLLKKSSLLLLGIVLASLSVSAQEHDAGEMMAKLTKALDLSEKQQTQVQTLVVNYKSSVDLVLLKYEGQEEPDVGAMIGEIRDTRDVFREGLQGFLSPNQYDTYLDMVEQILTDMFNDIALVRLLDFQPEVGLTDNQVTDLVPVLGKSLLSTMAVLIDNAGERLSVPKKLGIKNKLQDIDKEKRAGMEKIMTPDQMKMYDAYKEAQKEASKG